MKRTILYSVCIGTLALALTAWGEQVKRQPARAAAPRTANVHAARPASTHANMGARHSNSTAQFRQRSYAKPPTSSHVAVNQKTRMNAVREQNVARNQEVRARRNVAVNHERNMAVNRTRDVAVNRERNLAVNRTKNAEVNRARNNAAVNRERNLAANRTRNVEVNRNRNFNGTKNFAYYRGGNARINNNFRSEAFRGRQYAAFRNYHRQWHDRGWWRNHYNRIIFVNNGWYYWNAGYWFPAWGYATDAYYPYDGPIYGYNGLTPDRVTVDVQQQLQRDGYYDGPIDGALGPMTREAIAAFQADNGLAVTSVIDEPTLASLGIS